MGLAVTRRSARRSAFSEHRRRRLGSGPVRRLRDRRLTLLLLLVTSLTLLTLDVRGFAPLAAARGAARAVFAPVAEVAAGALAPVGEAWRGAFEGADLARQNDELRRRVEELQGRSAQDDAAAAELDKLREALDLPYAGQLERVTASVTSGAVADFDATIEIDKGADAGLAPGMPVVVDAGLVGSIAQVSGGRAVVRLISDHATRVGVVVAGGSAHGVVEGRGGEVVRATSFDLAADLPTGSMLVTAGTTGSLYPPGIPVGTVERIERETGAQQVADVRLAPRLDDLAFVTVLLHRAQ